MMRIEFFTRAGCSLCDEGRAVLARVAGERPWTEIDVDEDPGLAEAYGELVPVVEVDGVKVGQWRIEESALREALGGNEERAPRRLWRRRAR